MNSGGERGGAGLGLEAQAASAPAARMVDNERSYKANGELLLLLVVVIVFVLLFASRFLCLCCNSRRRYPRREQLHSQRRGDIDSTPSTSGTMWLHPIYPLKP
ncbi:hypothetical protein E2562_033862 [Oryza meyeriana var. granulata]|uniref:Uncharacterized protein n=1 Tax=Oryza meyeriana var. granulata TaxID=110450 RepID=A0A6G1BR53_9ORYZ|nr:hypothetical protein E2562_033862 [Oryza meyeriana var. granulata]